MSIGVDISKNSRFKEIALDEKKYSRILSFQEIEVYKTITLEKRKLEYLSSRFASKEALFKATNHTFQMKDVSILNEKDGRPYIVCDFCDDYEISLSHEDEYSIAFVCKKQ